MPTNRYITASCIIKKTGAYRNGQVFFKGVDTDPAKFFTSLYQFTGSEYPKFYKMDNLSRLGWLAAEILINKGADLSAYKPEEKGVVLSNSSSSLDVDTKFYESAKDIASPALFVYTLPNIVVGEICIRHRIKGENAFFISQQFDSSFIEQYVSNLINNNILQACICGWTEFRGNEYKAMLILVEKGNEAGNRESAVPFTIENINKIYQRENG